MTIVFFSLSGLDLLCAQDILDKERDETIKFIYALQIVPKDDDSNLDLCGFRGSTTIGSSFGTEFGGINESPYDCGHVAMTYTSLLSLLILGDDLSGVNKRGVTAGLRKLQLADGSFCATPDGSENDMRFVYCACCISYVLDDWSGVHVDSAVTFIQNSLTYEGCFAQGPGLEGHGGSTFCAVASLVLMDRLHSALTPRQLANLKRWCLLRQHSGFQGRPNKPVDTCYSFWVGATLKLLEIHQFSNDEFNRNYLAETEDKIVGGFSKWPSTNPDPMHSYFGLCGLSLMKEQGLRALHPALNISDRVVESLQRIHESWRSEKATLRGGVDHMMMATVCGIENNSISSPVLSFQKDQHVAHLSKSLRSVLEDNSSADIGHKLAVGSFVLTGLDLLGELHSVVKETQYQLVDWIYSLHTQSADALRERQICLSEEASVTKHELACDAVPEYLRNTYLAVTALLTLGDDLGKLDKQAVLDFVRSAQQEDGSFCEPGTSKPSVTSAYHAICLCAILQDYTCINSGKARLYLLSCLSREQRATQQVFCAVASLSLLRSDTSTETLSEQEENVKAWCVEQQKGEEPAPRGLFYSEATLAILGETNSCCDDNLLLKLQYSNSGGFSQNNEEPADVIQSFYSLCTLSLRHCEGLYPLHAPLCVSVTAYEHLRSLWRVGD